ncbi:transposase [Streptomyces sp. NPDC020800]|uniref:transposase n=1 Tax=Streptomyces sp. NPDC020800 TaxID=3365092 RepID=UPI0037BDCC3E
MSRGDLTDAQWERLERLLPPIPTMGRPPRDRRQVFDGIWWRGPDWLALAGRARAIRLLRRSRIC